VCLGLGLVARFGPVPGPAAGVRPERALPVTAAVPAGPGGPCLDPPPPALPEGGAGGRWGRLPAAAGPGARRRGGQAQGVRPSEQAAVGGGRRGGGPPAAAGQGAGQAEDQEPAVREAASHAAASAAYPAGCCAKALSAALPSLLGLLSDSRPRTRRNASSALHNLAHRRSAGLTRALLRLGSPPAAPGTGLLRQPGLREGGSVGRTAGPLSLAAHTGGTDLSPIERQAFSDVSAS
ncbi:uncharacterized protein LOC144490977, partial [Mustelus asterias]